MRSFMRRFQRRYGASPWHLLAVLASFAIIAVAVTGWFAEPAVSLKYILIWFAAAIVVHDVFLVPLYSSLDRVTTVHRRRDPAKAPGSPPVRVPGRVYVRVPLILSGMLALVFAPEILNLGDSTYHVASGQHQHVYLARYLAIVAVLFALSGLAYVCAGAKRRPHGRPPRPRSRP